MHSGTHSHARNALEWTRRPDYRRRPLLTCSKKLAEAKIYAGPRYHIKGVGQLIGRYTTGREGRGLLISYVRKKDIKGIVEKLRAAMDAELPEKQIGPCEDHTLKWSLKTSHKHSSGEVVPVDHIGCNLAS